MKTMTAIANMLAVTIISYSLIVITASFTSGKKINIQLFIYMTQTCTILLSNIGNSLIHIFLLCSLKYITASLTDKCLTFM